ncbi:MAG TPA: hypothetical protein VJ692_11270 [Nitrospiraceae bacterium]|nr:hypothetical protein [Nitrospiraceae bacterium]
MPIIMQIVCDRCQAVKREVNHWYALTASEHNATIQPLDLALAGGSKIASGHEIQYLCGRLCAVEAMTDWMDRRHCRDESVALSGFG